MLSAQALAKRYQTQSGIEALFSRGGERAVTAVDGVSFTVGGGEVLGIAGESGCGKSTLARMLLALEPATSGSFTIDGNDGWAMSQRDRRRFYCLVQMVFQDPYASLNPSHDVARLISSPLLYQGHRNRAEVNERVVGALASVGLTPAELYLGKHPHLLSGGQRQRLCIARALILDPRVIVADEPVSMLDVSIKWDIVRLLRRLVSERRIALVYITHDLATVRAVCDRIAIMYLGRFVETGPAEEVLRSPAHPYTRALVAAVPGSHRARDSQPALTGEIGTATADEPGCRFRPRCPVAMPRCAEAPPPLVRMGEREVACFREAPA